MKIEKGLNRNQDLFKRYEKSETNATSIILVIVLLRCTGPYAFCVPIVRVRFKFSLSCRLKLFRFLSFRALMAGLKWSDLTIFIKWKPSLRWLMALYAKISHFCIKRRMCKRGTSMRTKRWPGFRLLLFCMHFEFECL